MHQARLKMGKLSFLFFTAASVNQYLIVCPKVGVTSIRTGSRKNHSCWATGKYPFLSSHLVSYRPPLFLFVKVISEGQCDFKGVMASSLDISQTTLLTSSISQCDKRLSDFQICLDSLISIVCYKRFVLPSSSICYENMVAEQSSGFQIPFLPLTVANRITLLTCENNCQRFVWHSPTTKGST